jgi:hypothetical protein
VEFALAGRVAAGDVVFAVAGWLDELEQAASESTPASTAPIPHTRARSIRIRIVNIPTLAKRRIAQRAETYRYVPQVT